MQTHVIPDSAVKDKYGDGVLNATGDFRLMVVGQRGVGFAVGAVTRGSAARQVQHGPEVPGPWAYAFGLPAVIDNHGGSAREIAEAKAAGLLVEAEVGDVVILDGAAYRIDWADRGRDRHNVRLTLLADLTTLAASTEAVAR